MLFPKNVLIVPGEEFGASLFPLAANNSPHKSLAGGREKKTNHYP